MYPLGNLYAKAARHGIPIYEYPLPHTGSLSFQDGEMCCIGMDESVFDGGALERVHLGHELGHCMTGSFYNIYASRDLRQRQENRADKWAIRELITEDALDTAIASGCTELWSLAEHFGVTEQFARKAVCLYTHGNLATQLYF